MNVKLGTAAALLVATLAVATLAHGAEQTREAYVAAVEPICKRDRDAADKILDGVGEKIKDDKLKPAGRQLVRAANRFGKTVGQLIAVPRPPADEAKLQRWFDFLRLLEQRIRKTGRYLLRGLRLKATHEMIRAERAGNAANNVSFSFGFRYCRLDRSRFN
jgi:hypothetical protein